MRALRAENEQLELQNREIEGKLEVLEGAYEESIRLEGLLVTAQTEAELSRLRALEEARAEHQRALRREQDMADRERNIARAATEEKAALEKELRDLHVELAECKAAMSEASVYDDEESHTTTGCGGGVEVTTTNSGVLPWVTTTTRATAGESGAFTSNIPALMSRSTESVARSSVITASTEGFLPLMASGVTTGTNTTPTAVIVSGITATRESGTPMLSDSSESSSAPDESGMLATMSRLIQAQTEALAAQTRAAATQHLPPLKPFTGEGIGMDDGNSFEKWIEHFEE